jgi:hypothetical protein
MTASIHVTFKSRFGLCNRLRGLAGYYALSKSLNWELFYTWEADPSCPGLIDEVFLPIPGALSVAQLPKPNDQTLSIATSTSGQRPTHCGSPPELTFQAHGRGQVDRATFDGFVVQFYQLLTPHQCRSAASGSTDGASKSPWACQPGKPYSSYGHG